jgi:hypothetical protein
MHFYNCMCDGLLRKGDIEMGLEGLGFKFDREHGRTKINQLFLTHTTKFWVTNHHSYILRSYIR